MRKGFRQILVLILLVAVTSIYLNGTRIFSLDPNGGYLSNLRYEGVGNEWNKSLFGDQARWASMENYIRLANEYDQRRAYGLMADGDEARYHKAFSDLARNALSDWQDFHMNAARDKTLKKMDMIPTWYEIRHSKSPPLVIAGVLAAAYTGRMLHYRLGSDMTVDSRTILSSSHFESQYFGWGSNLIGASFGSTFDGATRTIAMTASKQVASGVSVNYDHQTDNDALSMVYSTGF